MNAFFGRERMRVICLMCVYGKFLVCQHSDPSLFTEQEDGCGEGMKGNGVR